jgi:hypothetical protein
LFDKNLNPKVPSNKNSSDLFLFFGKLVRCNPLPGHGCAAVVAACQNTTTIVIMLLLSTAETSQRK